MKCYQEVACPNCRCNHIMKLGKNAQNIQRYRCENNTCPMVTFMLSYRYNRYNRYNACAPRIKEQCVEMAINSSGIRDTLRVLGVDENTIISILKIKEDSLFKFTSLKTQKIPMCPFGASLRRSRDR